MSKTTKFSDNALNSEAQPDLEESWTEMKQRQEKELEVCESLQGEAKQKMMEKLKQQHSSEQIQHEIHFKRKMEQQKQESECSSEMSMPVINEMTFKLTELFAYVGETCEKIATEKSKGDFLELQNKQVIQQLSKYKQKVKRLKQSGDAEALARAE